MRERALRLLRVAGIAILDAAFLCASFAGAIFLFTYMRAVPGGFMVPYAGALPYMIPTCWLVFFAFGIYRDMWGYISMMDVARLAVAAGLAALLGYVEMRLVWGVWLSPIIGVTAFYLFLTCVVGMRMLPTLISTAKKYYTWRTWSRDDRVPMLIVGAGSAAAALIKEMQDMGKDCPYRIVGAVDDDVKKFKQALRGVNIIGTTKDIPELVRRDNIQEIVIAIPSATTELRRKLIALCAPTGCKVRFMSAVADISQTTLTNSLRNMELNDLLGRKEVVLDPSVTASYITGQRILVTGGGGSIGSELCRQIMRFDPEMLIVYEIYENNAYDIEQEMHVRYPDRKDRFIACIGSVQDRGRLQEVMGQYKPQVVFHAAAHKHVPLMEKSPVLAIENNVFGTYSTALASIQNGVKRFVMISTDKAVNPTNIMGASKRLSEMIIHSLNGQGTEFIAVRFGNVLGSNGSVVPVFRRQIEAGGPVTVMHPDIIRYFMTIPEASRLVLQAGARAKGGETFVLDMGEPIKILDLATTLIEMAGLVPYVDIPIIFTGLRPGEKLYEELLLTVEDVDKTEDEKIYITRSSPIAAAERRDILNRLHKAIAQQEDMRKCLQEILPSYHPQE